MSEKTKKEVMLKLRSHYLRGGAVYRRKLIDQAVALMGYHRKSAIRALSVGPALARVVLNTGGRPRKYDEGLLLPPLKKIWLCGQQPCGKRLVAMLPEWIPGYEAYHCSLSSVIKEQLLEISSATLDRMLAPAMMSAAAFANGMPTALETNGTVREALGFASSTYSTP